MAPSVASRIVLLAALTAGPPAFAQREAAAGISQEQAAKAALERVPGAVIERVESRRESGRSVWAFDLRSGGLIREVWVDAETGTVLKDLVQPAERSDAGSGMDRAEKAVLERIHGDILSKHVEKIKNDEHYVFVLKAKDGRLLKVEFDERARKIVAISSAEEKRDAQEEPEERERD